MGKRVSSPKWTVFACEAIRLSAFSAWTWSHGRRDPCLLVRNPFPDEWGVAENAPSELRHKETMESCYPAERLAPKQDPVGQCLLVVQLKRRSPGSGHKPGWPYLTRLVEALQSGTSMDRSKLELAFWPQILKHVYVGDCWELVNFHGKEIWFHTWHSAQARAWSCLTSQEPKVAGLAGRQWSGAEGITDLWQHFLLARWRN